MFKITKVVTDLSNEKYHSVGTEIISSSYLKGIYKHSIKRAKIPMESNDALVFGTQFHDICELGIQGFQDKYSVIPEKYSNKRTKLYKEYIEANPDAISIDDLNRLTKMFYNLQTNEFYRQLEDGCESHVSILFMLRWMICSLGLDQISITHLETRFIISLIIKLVKM
jgi:hypothetical protein